MAYEFATIDAWIYQTLSEDATLAGLLAVDNRPPDYQQGIYNMVAPEIDPISRKQPAVPFIVFAAVSQSQERAVCGTSYRGINGYRVTLWDNDSGSVSATRAQTIMARVDTLLGDKTVTTTTPNLYCTRETADQTYTLNDGGRTDIAVTATYQIITRG